jgi:hypothetical protein
MTDLRRPKYSGIHCASFTFDFYYHTNEHTYEDSDMTNLFRIQI